MLGTRHSQRWASTTFAVFSATWTQEHSGRISPSFRIQFLKRISFFPESSFTRRRCFTWRDVNVLLDFSEERAALIVESEFSKKKKKKKKPLWKMEGREYEMKLTCGLCLDVKSLSLGKRGKMNSPCVFNKANIAEWSLRVFSSITYLSVILLWIMQILKTSALREASTTLSVHVEIF